MPWCRNSCPSREEQRLYDLVSEYLQQPTLYALPASQRSLMTLILRKLLASSTYAISDTLSGLAFKLETRPPRPRKCGIKGTVPDQPSVGARRNGPEGAAKARSLYPPPEQLADNWEEYRRTGRRMGTGRGRERRSPSDPSTRRTGRRNAAGNGQAPRVSRPGQSIVRNSKGEVLLTALRRGFAAASKAKQKKGTAPICRNGPKDAQHKWGLSPFPAGQPPAKGPRSSPNPAARRNTFSASCEQTEFRRQGHGVQRHEHRPQLQRDLPALARQAYTGTDRVSGSPCRRHAGRPGRSLPRRGAIMIATEAAAEGINLQFCNLVVNYDLPWNPQRIEQRIGRCHRYGQKFDVVVVNFLNKSNAADQRVYRTARREVQALQRRFRAPATKCSGPSSPAWISRNASPPSTRNAARRSRFNSSSTSFNRNSTPKSLPASVTPAKSCSTTSTRQSSKRSASRVPGLLDRFNERLWLVTRYLLGRLRPI